MSVAPEFTAAERIAHLERCLNDISRLPDPMLADLARAGFEPDPLEAAVLGLLVQHKGRQVSREALMAAMYWPRPREGWPEPGIVKVIVSKIRSKAKACGVPLTIRSVWSVGYVLEAA